MNDSTLWDRNDTGILSLADLFRRDRLPCRAEPRRFQARDPAPPAGIACANLPGGAGLTRAESKAGSPWVSSTTTSAAGAERTT